MTRRLTCLACLALAGCGGAVPLPPLPPLPVGPVEAPSGPPPDAGTTLAPVRDRQVLTLADCLVLAEGQSERLGSLLQDIRIAEAQRALARSSALPKLSANASLFRQEDIGSSSLSNLPERKQTWLSLEQPLFRGFQDLYAIRSAGFQVDAAERTREGTLLEVRLAVSEAYGRLLSIEQQREAVASSLTLARNRLEELKARLQVGLSRRTEVLFAEAQVARNEAQEIQLGGEWADARAFLGFLLGIPVEVPLAPFPPLQVPSLEPESLTGRARAGRRDLAALARQAAAAREAVRAEQAGHWPSLDLTGNVYGKREGPSEEVDWDLTLLGRLPLFEGGATRAKVREAEAQQRKAGLALREKRRRIAQDVQEAVSAYQASRAVLDSLEREVAATRETEELLREEVRQGIAPQIEQLTAQDALLTATVSLARQRIDERLAALRLWGILGDFPSLPPEEESR